MERAIDDYAISGVETTLGFCRYVMGHKTFRSGKYDTHFVRDHFKPEYLDGHDAEEQAAAPPWPPSCSTIGCSNRCITLRTAVP